MKIYSEDKTKMLVIDNIIQTNDYISFKVSIDISNNKTDSKFNYSTISGFKISQWEQISSSLLSSGKMEIDNFLYYPDNEYSRTYYGWTSKKPNALSVIEMSSPSNNCKIKLSFEPDEDFGKLFCSAISECLERLPSSGVNELGPSEDSINVILNVIKQPKDNDRCLVRLKIMSDNFSAERYFDDDIEGTKYMAADIHRFRNKGIRVLQIQNEHINMSFKWVENSIWVEGCIRDFTWPSPNKLCFRSLADIKLEYLSL